MSKNYNLCTKGVNFVIVRSKLREGNEFVISYSAAHNVSTAIPIPLPLPVSSIDILNNIYIYMPAVLYICGVEGNK